MIKLQQTLTNPPVILQDFANHTAFSPEASIFVSANAGAGKTSLLTNRVLSLLLHGIAPAKILCLTFTNAAAAEMMSRVLSELGKWVMADTSSLSKSLEKLTGEAPPPRLIKRARGLFAAVLEAPEGVRIQTIHGFSQSLLRRFPLEAGISPHFSVMDSSTEHELLKEARMRLFSRAQNDEALYASLRSIANDMSESTVNSLLREIISHKSRFRSISESMGGIQAASARLYNTLGVEPHATLATIISANFSYDASTLAALRAITGILLQGKATDSKTGAGLAAWLEKAGQEGRELLVAAYMDVFLTKEGEPRQRLFTKETLNDAQAQQLLDERERVLRFHESWKAWKVAQSSHDMLHIAQALLELYEELKRTHVQMDYDDLILTARSLLMRPGIAPWVLFKLDGGIDHVLIDEAQDTSPIQWQIVTALTQEFFAGLGRTDAQRSLFVVGDEKQSIYSFQGADPIALGKMQRYFTRQIEDAAKPVHTIALTRSYRSTREVLQAVDSIFERDAARHGLTFDGSAVQHIPTRLSYPGTVEVWPLILPAEYEDAAAPLTPISLLAHRIADQIAAWLKEGLWLEGKGRSVQPGDIMVLVRTRTSFVDRLVRRLKRRGVPVAGHDRMKLGDNLAVQDLIALGCSLLLPEDDLTLAAVLKSPIFNISEEALFTLAYNRGKATLWQRLREHADKPEFQAAYELFTQLRSKTDFIPPFELYSYLLDSLGARSRFVSRMGDEYNDPIDEFLGQALLFERSHTPSLQGFIHWLSSSESIIKRDMEQSQGTVRIMTVHGAKGLQAPIVILPDTMGLQSQPDALLWQEDEHTIPQVFWPRSRRNEESICSKLRMNKRDAELCEYRRQLYVALTRAEDQLYICGASSKKNLDENSWYYHIQQGLQGVSETIETPWGEGMRLGRAPLYNRTTQATPLQAETTPPAHFDFLRSHAPAEPTPPQPLVPSRFAGEEPAGASPLTAGGTFYQRGTLIHRLLQYLPDINKESRAQAAANIAKLYRATLDEQTLAHCISEALHIIEHEPFAFLFGEGSLAEAPVAGSLIIKGKQVAVSGQIDRLHIGKDRVWIVDFKSGRAAPENISEIPAQYVRQMRLYQLLLKDLYPDKSVYCGILWTATPKLDELSDAQLDEVDVNTYI